MAWLTFWFPATGALAYALTGAVSLRSVPRRPHTFTRRLGHTHSCAPRTRPHTQTHARILPHPRLPTHAHTDARTHTHPHVGTQLKISYYKYRGILICNCLSPSSESLSQGKECLAFEDNYRREILPVIFGREENGYKRNPFYVTASSTHIDPRRFLELIVMNWLISCSGCSAQAGEAAIPGMMSSLPLNACPPSWCVSAGL